MGEYGMADAFRNKRLVTTDWLADQRAEVQAFARLHIAELDLRIAAEQRRAEESIEMRRHSFEESDEEHAPE
jgi:hypothetical protein